MKNLYIPKEKTLHYEAPYYQNIVNDGMLIVDGTLHVRSISDKDILKASTVSVRHVAEMGIECVTMNGETTAAERVCAAEIVLSGSTTVSCCLEAEYVEVPKLTATKHNIGTLKVNDVITLPEKKREIVGTLVAGFFCHLWLSVIHRIPVDAPYVQAAASAPGSTDTEQEQPKPERAGDSQSQPVTQPMDLDLEEGFEFKRLKAVYRLLKDCGHVLCITKQEETVLTPQEGNASILPKAAQPMENITIRQHREVTTMGITRVRELCAQGYIDQSGVFRLKRCVGRYGPKESCKTVNPVITNHVAQALKAEGDCAERGSPLAKLRR